jgi:peptidoglycan/LPS O-acetylase OafA/YrhL
MSAISTSPAMSARVPGLDGLRALAITLVLAYHLFPGLAPGGFLGVDIFLVVSGYLITALLIAEHRDEGRIRLRRFWARRARRLLPALIVVVGLSASVAALIGGDILVGIGWQLAGALTFSSNWWSIANGSTYLDQTSPELFRHFWSLAVEEQFYLLWPLVVIALLAVPLRHLRIALPIALAIASGVAMAVLAGDPAVDPTAASTAYYSTLTHGFGLLLGAGLALAREPLARTASPTRVSAAASDLAVLLAGLGLLALTQVLAIDAAITYRGGLIAAVLLTAVMIVGASHPRGSAAGVLDAPLARWLGERSYGLYLWHWPVLMLLGAALPQVDRGGSEAWLLGAAALVISVALAALSYRAIEQPVRQRRVRSILASWPRPRRVVAVTTSVLVLAGLAAGTALAVVRAPAQSEAAAFIAAGQAALDAAATQPLRIPLSERSPAEESAPTLPTGDQIVAIGDSVMLAAAPQLQARWPGIAIDAVVSRQMRQAPEILRSLAERDKLRPIVIVHLGTNGSIDPSTLKELRSIIGSERQLVLVSAQAPRDWITGVNRHLFAFAADYREVVVADWRRAITPKLNLLARDQVHPGSAGGRVYADAVETALLYLASLPEQVDYDENPELWRPR